MGLSVRTYTPITPVTFNQVPFWVYGAGFTAGIMAMGLGDGTPTTVRTPASVSLGAPSPSPDGNWIMWTEVSSLNVNTIKVCPVDDVSTVTTVATWTPNSAHVVGLSSFPCWLTNDFILYDKYLSTANTHELRYVGRDGTGDTFIEGPITSYGASLWPSVSQNGFGGFISYSVIPDGTTGPAEIYVSNFSASTLVHTCQWRLSADGRMVPAWKRGSDVLGFCDMPNPTSGTSNWYTVLPDGTGKTNIYADSSRLYWPLSRNAWLGDDSGMVTLKALGGNILTGSDSRVTIMDGSGGGPTDLSPSLDTSVLNNESAVAPYIWNQGDGITYRIYVPQYDSFSGGRDGVSVLEDGSDYFVDSPYSYLSRIYMGFGWIW